MKISCNREDRREFSRLAYNLSTNLSSDYLQIETELLAALTLISSTYLVCKSAIARVLGHAFSGISESLRHFRRRCGGRDPGRQRNEFTSRVVDQWAYPTTLRSLAFPESLRSKLLPVIHGMTSGQVQRSAQAARLVGSKSLGFGGFQTSGPNAGVNSFTPRTLRLLVQFAQLCAKWRLGAHVFGIGGPAAVPVLHYAAVKTFDSAGWIRTAAYGNVHLPYLGAVNITGATASRRYVTRREFNQLRRNTGHICPFCVDEVLLVRSWRHRALHNYCTVKLLTRSLKDTSESEALAKLRRFNPRFAGYLEIVLQERARHDRNSTSPEISADP